MGSEKHEITTKEDWIKLLEDNDVGRSNMNKLIMNYLVTGKYRRSFLVRFRFMLVFKRVSKKRQRNSSKNRA